MPISDYVQQDIYIAVDSVVFTIYKWTLQILLIEIKNDPNRGLWAIPWWFVKDGETLKEAAYRELLEETNVKNVYLEQLYTFSGIERDPRWRVISTIYMALVNHSNISLKAWTDAADVKFFSLNNLPSLAFDHKEVVSYALKRLRYKLEYTNVAQYFLPQTFSLTELQNLYETVLGKEFDVRNFRKKLNKLNMVRATWYYQENVTHRPAKLYEFVDKDVKIFDVLWVNQ